MNSVDDLSQIRREYQSRPFNESDLATRPVRQFACWFAEHQQLDPDNATAMVLATASLEGVPSARVVLLKHYDGDGFCWYSDYRSDKGQALAENPQAQLLFYWPLLDRQVRISGRVKRMDRASALNYFNERPRGSQLSAAASYQSQKLSSRAELESAVERLAKRSEDQPIPCPVDWGGYRLKPSRYEFWQGRENRLHDRLVYTREAGVWVISRLSP